VPLFNPAGLRRNRPGAAAATSGGGCSKPAGEFELDPPAAAPAPVPLFNEVAVPDRLDAVGLQPDQQAHHAAGIVRDVPRE
jgi:hypothetical protein